MWEAKAAPGQVAELERWVRSAVRGRAGEIYLGRGVSAGLVVVLLHLGAEAPAGDPDGPPLPDPPNGLIAGSAHAWQFERAPNRLDRSDLLG
ncbi:hypothetical protein [Parafrankia discariae]|uniref:hypothetical protein n=1 Tax=Parafrankia discariae TaxID=365528 RepID=UPI0006864897|nr:hypothetical protein [Parafrankia discariae]